MKPALPMIYVICMLWFSVGGWDKRWTQVDRHWWISEQVHTVFAYRFDWF